MKRYPTPILQRREPALPLSEVIKAAVCIALILGALIASELLK